MRTRTTLGLSLLVVAMLGLSPAAAARWQPRPTTAPWQIQLQGAPDTSAAAHVFEFDGDFTARRVVAALQRRKRRVICYLNAGAWENFRADKGAFPQAVLGKTYDGFPDERWLDIRRVDLLGPILIARIETCRRKGFDAVDPDNVNGYANDTGFPLEAADQRRFNRWLAAEIHARGMAAILKNDGPQARHLVGAFDGVVVEECFENRECGQYAPFARARKPIYAIEYRSPSRRTCREARRRKVSVIFKALALRAPRRTCADAK